MVYSVSNAFLEAVRQSGRRKTVVDVYYGKGTSAQLIAANLPVVDGSISVDSKATNRRSGSITIGDPDLFPSMLTNSPIEPYGAELVIRTGVVFPDTSEELVPLGRFPIYTISGAEEAGMFPEVRFFDRSKTAEGSGYLSPRDYSGKNCLERIAYLINYVFESVTINTAADVMDVRLPGGSSFSENHWARIEKLAETMGAEVFFDVTGQLQIRVPPTIDASTPTSAAVYAIDGGAAGVMTRAARTVTREDTYNRIGVYGAPPNGNSQQPYGEATDTNAASPTYFYGPFGKMTQSYQYPTLTKSSQCVNVARMLLARHIGLARSVDFGLLNNPALDVGDIILLKYPSDGVQELHIIDSLTIPLAGGEMTGKTRVLQ